MFVPDIPNLPAQSPAVVMIAQANQAQDSTKNTKRVLGVCELVDNEERKGSDGELYLNKGGVFPIFDAIAYFQKYEHRNDFTSKDKDSAKFTILRHPLHGVLEVEKYFAGEFPYTVDAGYVGNDSASILEEALGVRSRKDAFTAHWVVFNLCNLRNLRTALRFFVLCF